MSNYSTCIENTITIKEGMEEEYYSELKSFIFHNDSYEVEDLEDESEMSMELIGFDPVTKDVTDEEYTFSEAKKLLSHTAHLLNDGHVIYMDESGEREGYELENGEVYIIDVIMTYKRRNY